MRLEAANDMLRDRPYETGIVCPLDGDGSRLDTIAARMIHVCLARDHGCELRSSFWFTAGPGAFDEDLARAFVQHLEEEGEAIVTFLPGLWAAR